MKNSNHSASRKRLAFASLFSIPWLAKALLGVIILVSVLLIFLGGAWYVYRKITVALPKIVKPPDTNDVAFCTIYSYMYSCAADTNGAVVPAFAAPPSSGSFSFQYGMSSTNPVPLVWAVPGTNLPATLPASNNIVTTETVLWTLQKSADTLDFIYEAGGTLYRCTALASSDTQIDLNTTNLNLVVYKSPATAPYQWVPVFTNTQPLMDYPYTFTEPTTSPAALYQVGWQ